MRLMLFLLGGFLSLSAWGGIYKCTDATGKTNYQANPCTGEHHNIELNLKTGASVNLDEKQKQAALEQQQKEQQAALQTLQHQQQEAAKTRLKQEAIEESAKNQLLIKNNPQQFSAFAIPPYDYEHLPELVKSYPDRLPEIERFRRLAAQKALASGQCIRVEAVELNIKTSKEALIFLVDCSSAKKFYFSEKELIS